MTAPYSHLTVGIREGFRSGLEPEIANQLKALGIDPQYEKFKYSYIKPSRKHTYTPDFTLPNGIIIETKGRFLTEDRQKHLLIREQYPHLDIRFVFSNSKARLFSQQNKKFVAWLKDTHGIVCSTNKVPKMYEVKYREAFLATLTSKPSQTTNADWCRKHGFLFADKFIPQEWINEQPVHVP